MPYSLWLVSTDAGVDFKGKIVPTLQADFTAVISAYS